MQQDKKMTAYCGLNCVECPTYIATQKNNDTLRANVAKQWSEQFKMEFKPADMNCDGCKVENGQLFGFCHACEVRKCAGEKWIETCADCEDYACPKIQALVDVEPAIKEKLDLKRE